MASVEGGERPAGGLEGLSIEGTPGRRVGEGIAAVLAALFALFNFFPPSGDAFAPLLIGPLSLLTCFHLLRRAFDRGPRLVVDAEGIVDRTSIVGGELRIPWEEIKDVATSASWGTVELEVRDPAALQSGAGFWRRTWMWLGRLRGKRTISVNPSLLGLSKGALRDRLAGALLHHERVQLGLAPVTRELEAGEIPE